MDCFSLVSFCNYLCDVWCGLRSVNVCFSESSAQVFLQTGLKLGLICRVAQMDCCSLSDLLL